LKKKVVSKPDPCSSSSQISDKLSFDEKAQMSFRNFTLRDNSVVIENFYVRKFKFSEKFRSIINSFQGQFASVTKCSVCEYTSTNFEAFMSLTLPFPENVKKCSLLVGFSFLKFFLTCTIYL